jgi:hypothetical protein
MSFEGGRLDEKGQMFLGLLFCKWEMGMLLLNMAVVEACRRTMRLPVMPDLGTMTTTDGVVFNHIDLGICGVSSRLKFLEYQL